MNNKLKKATNISVATSVAISSIPGSLFADTNSILSHAMTNITKPNVYTERDSQGNVVSTNFYSGGVSFSFDNSYPPPLFSASPPSIEAGCNGINIKGMFVSLLGLDQLGAMLQNAGASLAWGVAIGLIYSLPGVASAFKMINQWAKDLQKLLGNACQSGIAIGQHLAKKAGIDKGELEKKMANAIPDWAKCNQEGENCVADALGLGDYFDKDGVFTFGGDNGELNDKDKKDAITGMLRGIFEADISIGGKLVYSMLKRKPASNLVSTITSTGLPSSSNNAITHKKFTIDFLGTGVTNNPSDVAVVGINKIVDTYGSESEKTRAQLALFGYVLLYNYAGDLLLTKTDEIVNSGLAKYTGDASKKEEALKFLENLKKLSPRLYVGGPGAAYSDEKAIGKKLANFILYGKVDRLKSPIFEIIQMEDEKSSENAFTIISSSDTDNAGSFDVSNFAGIKLSSACAIKAKLGETEPNECKNNPDLNVPVLIEDIDYFIKVIQNSPTNSKYLLEDALIQYNTKMAGQALLNSMSEALNFIDGSSKKFINANGSNKKESNTNGTKPDYADNTVNSTLNYAKRVSKILSAAREQIRKEDSGGIEDYKQIRAIFKVQEQENRARGMKNVVN